MEHVKVYGNNVHDMSLSLLGLVKLAPVIYLHFYFSVVFRLHQNQSIILPV